jgi:glucose-1-phosphate cytidylyltransferase
LEQGVFDYISGDDTTFERQPLERSARDGRLAAFKHDRFWQCTDAMRDVMLLKELRDSDACPWKVR